LELLRLNWAAQGRQAQLAVGQECLWLRRATPRYSTRSCQPDLVLSLIFEAWYSKPIPVRQRRPSRGPKYTWGCRNLPRVSVPIMHLDREFAGQQCDRWLFYSMLKATTSAVSAAKTPYLIDLVR